MSGARSSFCVPGGAFPSRSACGRRFRLFPTLCVVAILLGAAAPGRAQAPSFQDLAARAAAARDQQNLPAAVQLYAQAVQARPDWQEGWWYL